MKHYGIIILPSAERDIGEAYSWIAERDEKAAIHWFNHLLEVIFSLETFPDRCWLSLESQFLQNEIRQIFHGQKQRKYRVLFELRADEVRILHVRHGARSALGESI